MASNKGSEPKKRRLKDPETFRDRALKAAEDKSAPELNKPKRRVASRLIGPAKATTGRLKSKSQLKPVFKVFHYIGLVIFPNYFRSSFEELKKVTWPGFKQSRKLTYAVLIFAIIFGASVALIDYGFGKIFKHILLK